MQNQNAANTKKHAEKNIFRHTAHSCNTESEIYESVKSTDEGRNQSVRIKKKTYHHCTNEWQ